MSLSFLFAFIFSTALITHYFFSCESESSNVACLSLALDQSRPADKLALTPLMSIASELL